VISVRFLGKVSANENVSGLDFRLWTPNFRLPKVPLNSKHQSAKPLREIAGAIVTRLQGAGFEAFWVGGCVRDFLLGREPEDYDIATSARPEQIEKLFPRTIPVGRKFGVIVVVEATHQFQVATFRAEADYQDGRRPEKVVFGDARADALRRDFTVNGLFFDPKRQKLHDWVGGEADLRAKIIRTIGSPEERFGEDHLRLLRAVRLAAQLDFKIEAQTFAAIKANASKVRGMSAERIREELVRLFRPPHASRGLELLRQSGLLEQVLPEIAATIACEQSPDFHPEGSVFNHLLLMLEKMPPDAHPSLPWAVLFHDVAKPVTASADPQTGAIHFYGHEKIGAETAKSWGGCGFRANKSKKSFRQCFFTCSSRMRCRCANPRSAGCSCAQPFRWNWHCTALIAWVPMGGWMFMSFWSRRPQNSSTSRRYAPRSSRAPT
jgi:tRNA nucleotidyltransferase/poly(A) polymerase